MTNDKELFILTSSSKQILTYGSAEESMTDDKELFILTSSSSFRFMAVEEGRTFLTTIDISYINIQFQILTYWSTEECMIELTNNKELFILASNSALDFWPVEEGRTFPITIDISYINLQFQV
ncbi:hypothetical protein SUGI_0597940 [Cryptomeria japonica]|uniref:uncharacterized protein LOC131064938 n=1 Tax=Cryptomeria japonica TaxID=3369 RepID=UPI002414ABF2|nr:uncharacterized protein LOC131064938 [Cryptomeria japonica]GLJ30227.1 hypothetical protein SUGI_0597940 [Cryptomeria japonica]